MNQKEKMEAASNFLLQSPPGEINDVLNDIRTIISDDSSLQTGILPALKEYNVQQFVTVDVPGADHQVIISEAGRLPSSGDAPEDRERFLDPRSKQSFLFDHLRLEAEDPQPAEADSKAEPFRAALETAALKYISDHYADGVVTVFAQDPKNFLIQLVANKYNPQNYWSGRWRSEYKVDLGSGSLTGHVQVNVHYYEQGNVQLSTTYKPTLQLPPNPTPATANKILLNIAEEEKEHQSALSNAYHEMGEKTFKGLRRALPLTRNKLDWDKVTGYKLGAELTANRGTFGQS